jgi:DNA-binding IclR family transcriptional regulator
VLAKLRDYLADKRNQRAIQAEISRRTRKAQANVEALEKQLGAVRAKIERGTENLALANPEDVPGVSRLLAGWRDEETKLKEKLQQARGEGGPTPESLAIMARIDHLLDHLSEADREKLAFAIRQTVKRITLRRTRLGDGRHRVTLWDGAIELRDDLGPKGTIPLTDDELAGPGRWRDAARFVREHGGVVYLGEVAEALGINKAFASRLLAQATLAGKIRNLGHQQGWTGASPRS